jgi:putative ABC transport system permease protein
MSLALATLLYEWRRYMAAVVALAFSGLLVLAQVGMFVGIGKGFTAQIDRARADIMVLGPGAKALFGGPSGLPRRMIPLVYSHPEVTQVAPLDGSGGRFQNILSPEQQAKEEARAKKAGKGKGKAAEAAVRPARASSSTSR